MAMSRVRILVIYGTRPEAIKLAPVIQVLRSREDCQLTVCSTGQHREMLHQVESLFDLTPDRSLDVMVENQGLNGLLARLLLALDELFATQPFDWVVVQGDTTTALAGALAGFHRQVQIAHVEAGLRSGNMQHPFPEEANRVLIDRIASVLFAPTTVSRDLLLQEGHDAARVVHTGNTVVDALLEARSRLEDQGALKKLPGRATKRVLVTLHRRESHGAVLLGVLGALRKVSLQNPEVRFYFPVHKNPAVRTAVERVLGDCDGFVLSDPVDYATMISWLSQVDLVVTDSGGLQEEAPSSGVPVLVVRETTERPEGVEAGVSRLIGTDEHAVERAVSEALLGQSRMAANARNPYGDGKASLRIAQHLVGVPVLPFED